MFHYFCRGLWPLGKKTTGIFDLNVGQSLLVKSSLHTQNAAAIRYFTAMHNSIIFKRDERRNRINLFAEFPFIAKNSDIDEIRTNE